MKFQSILALVAAVFFSLGLNQAQANGAIGEHVNELEKHLGEYTEEVQWLIGKMTGMVETYENQGAKAAKTDRVMEFWEEVDFHAAIETTYVPLYASIWQGLFAVKGAIDANADMAEVKLQLASLETTLWQSLGAVKLAAKMQKDGVLAKVQTTETEPTTALETINDIQNRLDRVVAKHAERLNKVAKNLVFDTYFERFEGVEGTLIEFNAELVEDLEKAFNVTLPKALDSGASVDKVRGIVNDMKTQLDEAKSLVEKAEKRRKDVF